MTHAVAGRVSNTAVADAFDEVATLLDAQGANPFRSQAWRNAAATIRAEERPLAGILADEGVEGLDRLPGIGPALARSIRELLGTGRLAMLDRLRGESDPLSVLESVPGVGEALARKLHEELGIDTLEELEVAAHDGTLAQVSGFGEKRIAGIRDALQGRLGRRRTMPRETTAHPPVAELLDVDREYREGARAGTLPLIAPRRFNPEREPWLPVLHTRRGSRHYTALFSNTSRAHQLGKTRDWVVLYHDAAGAERQCTVVTATAGPLAGERVVRGREAACIDHYQKERAQHDRVPR